MSSSFPKTKKSGKTKAKENKKSLLGLSVLDFTGFHICQIRDKKALTVSLAKHKVN